MVDPGPALVAAPGGSTNSRPVTSSERLTSEISSPARRATELTGNSIARSPAVDWKRRQSSPALAMAASRRCSGPLPEAHAPNVSTGSQLGDVLAHMAPPNPRGRPCEPGSRGKLLRRLRWVDGPVDPHPLG